MTQNKVTHKTKGARICRREPVAFSLVKAVAWLRKTCFKVSGENESDYKHFLAARDVVVLGKLINVWKEVVGVRLALKTCPTKIFKEKLYLTVSDSQWMQNLLFIKSEIIKKIGERFPELKIKEVVGRIGIIPPEVQKSVKDYSWPDWRKEAVTPKYGIKDPKLAKSMDICQQKLNARLKGLEERGYVLCKMCRANVTRSKDGICAMCIFDHRNDIMMKSRSILAESPWLSYEEVRREQDLTRLEYEFIKNELLNDSLKLVRELMSDLEADYDEDTAAMVRKEMIRGVTLFTGETPDRIELSSLKDSQLPDKSWLRYLTIVLD